MTDEELMKAYQKGDAKAFSALFDRYEVKLRHFLMLRLGRKYSSEVEDHFQLIWLKVHQSRLSFDLGKRFSAWFFKIAWNVLYDRFRQIPFDEDEGDWENTEASQLSSEALVILNQDLIQLEKLLNELSPREREVLLLSDFEGLSAEEIGSILSISSGAIRQSLFRSRQLIRNRWKKAGGDK